MYIALSIVIVIACVLLTLVVLAQNSKGGGLAANFGAGNQTFGVRQTADLLEKLTWILACVILVLSIVCSFFTTDSKSSGQSDITNRIESTSAAPAFPGTEEQILDVNAQNPAADADAAAPVEQTQSAE